uniref:Nuclear pore membrane protein 121 n=1 Tax=Jaculus jaculus TaxID=51337 RepID=A0A8C5L1F5_JACJA
MSPAVEAAGVGERRWPIASAREGRGRGRGRGGPVGAALLGLSLVGLVLYLVPAAAALAWLAVGATAAWWGLSREPRGPRAAAASSTSSVVRDARRQRTLLASPPAKSVANGNLLEPRTPLGRPDPAEQLLMGSYLGKPGPPQPAPAQDSRELRDRTGRRLPARSPPPAPAARRVHHFHPALPTPLLRSPRRPSHRDCGTLSNRFVITPRRRYPIQQAQYSLLGALPTVCWNGGHKKAVLSPQNSRMVCSPVTVRIAPPDSKKMHSPLPDQMINSTLSSPSNNTPDPCAKETVLNALKERKKRTVEEEDPVFLDGQENKRRRHDSSGSGHSAFEPLVANGVPAAFVPKPGSLKRGLISQSSEDHLNKRSRTSSVSSLASTCTVGIPSSSRNAITSSYSSSRGVSQLWKRSGPTSSPFSSPASSRSETPERPAKKTREEEPCHPSSPPASPGTDKESQGEKVVDTTMKKQQNAWTSPCTPGSSGPRKRKIQLLPSRRGDQLTLPPPPELGYSITAEDLDLEKKASLQWFNKVLEDKTDVALNSVDETPPTTQPFTFALPTCSPPPLPASSADPLVESSKKMQEPPGPSSSDPAEAAAPSPPKTPSPTAVLVSSSPGPLPGTSSSHSKPTATFLGLSPASSLATLPDTKSPAAPQAEPTANVSAPPAPCPTPKPSMLFGMLTSPSPSLSSPAISAPSVASPMFKPIFDAVPKTESGSPLPTSSSVTAAATAASSSSLSTTASTSALAFNPVFGNLGSLPSVSLSAPFSLKQTTAPATTAAPSGPLFTGLATATSTVASSTTALASKPAFGFGVNTTASTSCSTVTSASQPLPFGGAAPVGASTSAPALASIFQFGKPPAASPASTGSSTSFSTAQAATGSTAGFSGFGSPTTAAASSQPTLTFSSIVPPTFNIPFGSSTKPTLPPYPGASPQPAFGSTEVSQQGTTKPALTPSFGSSFTFGNSVAAAPSPAPSSFGSTAQSAFGGLKASASTFGAPASTQPAFGSTTAVFSFGAATTQTTSSGTSTSVFGSSAPSPFTFGAFNFGAGQSGTAGTATPFGGGLSQKSTPFAFTVANTPESKPVFGGTSTPTFGQSTSTPGVGATGSTLSFGASTPTQGFVGVGPFGSAAPSFSIGAGSKTPAARQRLQARRQHTRKK